jgi:hypothetical protein
VANTDEAIGVTILIILFVLVTAFLFGLWLRHMRLAREARAELDRANDSKDDPFQEKSVTTDGELVASKG